MTKSKLYLILQAAVCVLLAALLSASAVGIYREGVARRAEHPMEAIYTPEIVAGKLAPIAPLFLAAIGLLAAGLLLGARDESANRPARDPGSARDLAVARVASPSPEMLREQRLQRRLMRIGRGGFAACMIPIGIHLLNPDHFPLHDPEGMFTALLRVLVPWAAIGLGALSVTALLRERSVLRETEAAKARMKAERAQGISAAPKAAKRPGNTGALQAMLILAAIALIIAGAFNGSARDVLYKAINICTECVGLG